MYDGLGLEVRFYEENPRNATSQSTSYQRGWPYDVEFMFSSVWKITV